MKSQRRLLKENKKKYEKLLSLKAQLGDLSLPEKEQYQSLLYSKKRNKAIFQDKLLKALGSIAIVILLVVVPRIPHISLMINTGEQTDLPSMENTISNNIGKQTKILDREGSSINLKGQVASNIENYLEVNAKANDYFSQGIEEYNTVQRVGASKVHGLESLYEQEGLQGYKALNEMLNYKLDKQIGILQRLGDQEESIEEINTDIEEVNKLEEIYKQAIYDILEQEGIAYRPER